MECLRPGAMLPAFEATTTRGRKIRHTDLRGTPTLIIFHRYARCAICNQRIRELDRVLPRLRAETGLRTLFVCHSARRRLLEEFGERALPFDLIADPDRELYAQFGVARSLLTTLKPKSIATIVSARRAMPDDGKPAGLERPLTMIPADFFVDADGRLVSAHYGEFLGDSWPMSTIERLAYEAHPDGPRAPPSSRRPPDPTR